MSSVIPAPDQPDHPTAPVAGPRRRGRSLGVESLVALAAGVVIGLLGFPLGWLWQAAAPSTPVIKVSGGAVYAQPEQEQMIAGEGWYVFLTAGAGVLLALLVWLLLRRYRGVPLLLGTILGALWCGKVAAWFGHWIGRAAAEHALRDAPVGTQFTLPLNLRVGDIGRLWLPYARGDVLAAAIAAAVVSVLLAGFSSRAGLRPEPPASQPDPLAYPVGGPPPHWQSSPQPWTPGAPAQSWSPGSAGQPTGDPAAQSWSPDPGVQPRPPDDPAAGSWSPDGAAARPEPPDHPAHTWSADDPAARPRPPADPAPPA